MGLLRETNHNSRGNKKDKNGYTPDHNDRNFPIKNARNLINISDDNLYFNVIDNQWYLHKDKENYLSFEESEAQFYRRKFTRQYGEQMQRHKQKGNYKRIKPFKEWRKSKQYCPEETYFQIGMAGVTVDKNTFKKIALAYIDMLQEYSREHNNCFTIVDVAIHFDEAVPQMHIRRVWHSVNPETGTLEIGQEKALLRAGVPCPKALKEGEKPSRYNNPKMTFDKEIREKLLDLSESYGLDIERKPIEGAKHNLSKGEAIAQKYAYLKKENERLSNEITLKEQKISELDKEITRKSEKIEELNKTIENYTDLQKQVAAEVERIQNERKADGENLIDDSVENENEDENNGKQ